MAVTNRLSWMRTATLLPAAVVLFLLLTDATVEACQNTGVVHRNRAISDVRGKVQGHKVVPFSSPVLVLSNRDLKQSVVVAVADDTDDGWKAVKLLSRNGIRTFMVGLHGISISVKRPDMKKARTLLEKDCVRRRYHLGFLENGHLPGR